MKKTKVACISDEINQKNIHGNNIRLIKLLKYFPARFDFKLFTYQSQNIFDFTSYENVELELIKSRGYVRISRYFSHRGYIKKILWYFLNYYSTTDYLWALKACRNIVINNHKFNFVLLQVPSLTNIIYGRYIAKKSKLPIIYDLRDDLVNFKNRFGVKILESWMMKYATLVVCTSNGSKDNLAQNYPMWKDKLRYIPNGYDANDVPARETIEITSKDIAQIVFTGVLYKSRLMAIEMMFKAIKLVENEAQNFKIIFYTDNHLLENMITKYDLDAFVEKRNIIHNVDRYYRVLRNADYLLSMNMDTPYSIPGKLYEYLAVNPRVIHIDNSNITLEVLKYFPMSKLILIDNIQELTNVINNITLNSTESINLKALPEEYVNIFSRKNIALKYSSTIMNHSHGE